MGPKKKAVKKKVGKKSGSTKGPTIIDGVPVAEMTKDQLEGHVRRLQTEARALVIEGATDGNNLHLFSALHSCNVRGRREISSSSSVTG